MLQWTWEDRYIISSVSCFNGYRPRSMIAGSYVVLFFIFWGRFILFSIVTALDSSTQGFPFLHILINTYQLLSSWWEPLLLVWGNSLFWFEFFWWLVMSSNVSCTCWSYVSFLWKNIYLDSLTFKNHTVWLLVFFFFCHWVVWVLYVYRILISYQIYDLQVFSPISFHFFWWFPLLGRSFLVWCRSTCLFLLLLLLLLMSIRKSYAHDCLFV